MKTIVFFTSGLLEKHGFQDGDLLSRVARKAGVDQRELLEAALEEFVLPRIEQDVEVGYYDGIHNPVRVERVDGRSTLDNGVWHEDLRLTPSVVRVPLRDIEALATRINKRRYLYGAGVKEE